MRVTPVDLTTGFGKDNAKAFNAQDLVCWIPEPAEGASTSPMKLRCAPGLNPFADVSDSPVRGMHVAQDRFFVVAGSTLWEITGLESAVPRGTIPGVGRVDAAHNLLPTGHEVMFVNGSAGYVFDTRNNTFAKVTDEGYPGSWTVDYIDGYMMQADPFGRFAFFSDIARAKEYNTLDRFDSEASPDKIVRPIVSQSEVVVFSERSTEFFTNTGATTGTFQSRRVSMERGIGKARYSAVRLDNSIFWLGDDGIFYRLNGYSAQPIAPGSIQKAITAYDWSQCFAYALEDQGHKIAYWTFPGGKTFAYDVVTGLWHRMASPGLDRWRVSHLVKWRGTWYAGDFQRGRVYAVDWTIADDNNQLVERELITPHLQDGLNKITPLRMDLLFNTGGKAARGRVVERVLTLFGDMPGGFVGDSPATTYTATGGVLPYVFTVASGALPTGLSLSSGGVISGTVSAAGDYSWTVRVTDARGLTVDRPDTATFGAVLAIYFGGDSTVAAGGNGFSISPTGTSIPAVTVTSPNADFASHNVLATGRIVYVTGPTTARYSDDGGATATMVTIPEINTAGYSGIYRFGGRLFIPTKNANGLLASADNGASYTAKSSGSNSMCLAGKTGLLVMLSTTSQPKYSADLGETWSEYGPRLDEGTPTFEPGVQFGASDGTNVVFGGNSFQSEVGFCPAVASTTDGIAFTITKLSNSIVDSVVSIVYGNGLWACGTNAGRVYTSATLAGPWTLVTNVGLRLGSIAFNNSRFFFATTNSTPGKAYYSTSTVESLIEMSNPFLGGIDWVAVRPAT